MKTITIGTEVYSSQGKAKITGIELTVDGSKYGIPQEKIFAEDKDRCVFDLDNGHWQFGYQINPIQGLTSQHFGAILYIS